MSNILVREFENQFLIISISAVMAAFFDHCISKIAVLIKDHVRKIEESGYMAKVSP